MDLFQSGMRETKITFVIVSYMDCLILRFFIIQALKSNSLKGVKIQSADRVSFDVYLMPAEMTKFFLYIKPLAFQTEIRCFQSIGYVPEETISMCSEFLEGKSVRTVAIDYCSTNSFYVWV